MKKPAILISAVLALALGAVLGHILVLSEAEKENLAQVADCSGGNGRFWEVQSIDTMKYSRDLAREKLNDGSFDAVIGRQTAAIAAVGATHVAIGTPYDEEFLPYLRHWVASARQSGLKVWFRGNLSGWEGWFGYAPISRIEHLAGIRNFILSNPGLFADGDVFDPCPECENGHLGDPRDNPELAAYRRFLSDERQAAQSAFAAIGRAVETGYFSMNYDVARLVMDPETAQSLGGRAVIDHYVTGGADLARDIADLSGRARAGIVLGEFGYPIPGIHGLSDAEAQAGWLEDALPRLLAAPELLGLNYWTNTGGSTALWEPDGSERPAVRVISRYYSPDSHCGRVVGPWGLGVGGARVRFGARETASDRKGFFRVLSPGGEAVRAEITAPGYESASFDFPAGPLGIAKLEKTSNSRLDQAAWFIASRIYPVVLR